MDKLIRTWMNCFILTLPTIEQKENRLEELTTWDNGPWKDQDEQQAKIKALEFLLQNADDLRLYELERKG